MLPLEQVLVAHREVDLRLLESCILHTFNHSQPQNLRPWAKTAISSGSCALISSIHGNAVTVAVTSMHDNERPAGTAVRSCWTASMAWATRLVGGFAGAPSEALRPAGSLAALDSAGTAHATAAWLQESLQTAGTACAAAGADVLRPQASSGGSKHGSGRSGQDSGASWRSADGSAALPGINSGKATAHTMLIRCMIMCRQPGDAAAGGPPPRKVLRNLPALLQDMALCVAEAVAAVYMSDVRSGNLGTDAKWAGAGAADGGGRLGSGATNGGPTGLAGGAEGRVFEEVSVPALLDPRLGTTRELERFRNHVVMAAGLRRTYGCVRDVYEDRCAFRTPSSRPE